LSKRLGVAERWVWGGAVTGFVQIIEFKTSKADELMKFNEEWRRDHPQIGPRRVVVSADRDQEGTYLSIVEFDSYEEAMKNSDDPETTKFAEGIASLCDGPPVFRNLDVIMTEER
jgi:hypothetical protein